ncbi:MAG: NAD-dependent epimerase/dehydratase family protein, partial [Verrucomicrobiota bacterium]|nr:NAD-dependent epimerase/dehydratase family protein [Verrucomicrobiota bacterium]
MPRILIAGCGYVGEGAADLFHERGWEVEGWTASPGSAENLSSKPYSVRAADISDAAAISTTRAEFDVVLQCASSGGGDAEKYRRVYLEGARNLAGAFPAASLLFTSSTSVYAQKDGEIVDEASPANPSHEKGLLLRKAENLVLAHVGIVARLGGIYGPGRSFLLRKVLAGEAVIDPRDNHFINQAHRDDIVSALFLLAQRRSELGGQIYNVVDNQPVLARKVYEWLSARLHRPLPPTGNAPTGRKRGDSNKRVSNKKLRSLGWEPRYPTFQSAMSE